MKLKFLLLLTLFSCGARSAEITCVSDPPTTSFILTEEEPEGYQLRVLHHQGVEHAPIFEGIATGYTLPTLADRYSYIQKMGATIQVPFSDKKCRFEEGQVSCHFSEERQIGNLKVDDYSLFAYEKITKTPFGTFKSFTVRFHYRVNRMPADITMKFGERDCVGF